MSENGKTAKLARLEAVRAKMAEHPDFAEELKVFEDLAADVGLYGDEFDPVLRLEAAMHFVTDPNLKTPHAILEVERFAHVPPDVITGWARQDAWMNKRSAFMRRWADMAKKQLGSRLNQLRMTTLERLESVQEMALQKLDDPECTPRSWEGVANALVSISKQIDKTRATLAREVVPTAGKELAEAEEPALSKVESAAVAKALLAARREALRAELKQKQLAAGAADVPPDVPPDVAPEQPEPVGPHEDPDVVE